MLRSAIILVTLVAVTTPTFAARKKPAPQIPAARPLGNPGSWITFDDYPANALRTSQQGRVAFRLAVSPNGAVTDCTIVSSSGVAELDSATCALIRHRATFVPTKTASTYSSSVSWLLHGRASTADGTKGRTAWDQGNYDKAMREWKAEAKKGNAAAQYNLAYVYSTSRERADPKQAEYWYQKAAAQGDSKAQTAYGSLLLQKGAAAQAQGWLEKAAATGDSDAQVLLGTELYSGMRFPKDMARAYAMMKAASDGGHRVATSWLRDNEKLIPADQRQRGLVLARQLGANATAKPQPQPVQPIQGRGKISQR